MLRFLLDQMIDVEVANQLILKGYDVIRISDIGLARATDTDVMKKSIEDNRILITLDEHFGDWVILPLSEHSGVIRIKANPTTTINILDVLWPFLEKNKNQIFDNYLVIISEKGYRWIKTVTD